MPWPKDNHKTLYRKLNIEQHESYESGKNLYAPEELSSPSPNTGQKMI